MISIIVPVYNVEKYLERCVLSLLELKTECEILLIDDGSTDSSGKLCDMWSENDSRIRVVHQENGGLSEARNTGIKNAIGDYVMFVDSDDFLESEQTEELIKDLKDVDIALGLYCNYYTNKECYEKESCDALLEIDGVVNIDSFLKAIPKDGQSCYMTAWRFIVNRKYLLKHNLFFMPGIYHEDEEWTMRLLCNAKSIQICHKYFYQYRQAREGAITGAVNSKHVHDRFKIMHCACNLLEKQVKDSEKANYIKNRLAQLYLSNIIDWYVLDRNEKVEACEKLKKLQNACVQNMCGKKGKVIKCCIEIVGVWLTCIMIYMYRRILRKI